MDPGVDRQGKRGLFLQGHKLFNTAKFRDLDSRHQTNKKLDKELKPVSTFTVEGCLIFKLEKFLTL